MNLDDIRLLYEYDRWANHRVMNAAATLTLEQFTRDLRGSFPSLRDTVVHLISAEWAWLTYWTHPSPGPELAADLGKRREALFTAQAFPDLAAVQTKWAEIEKNQIEFVSRLTEEGLTRMFPYRGKQVALAGLMQHLANHSTYHRGQVALMMRQLGAEPVATDFHVFLVEGRER